MLYTATGEFAEFLSANLLAAHKEVDLYKKSLFIKAYDSDSIACIGRQV